MEKSFKKDRLFEERYDPDKLIDAIKGKKFLIVGESHTDINVLLILEELFRKHQFSSIYLEALEQGSYKIKGNALKKEKYSVYAHNPYKYDRIIRSALDNGIEVYGFDINGRILIKMEDREIDPNLELLKDPITLYLRCEHWMNTFKQYKNENSTALILTGAVHAIYSDEFFNKKIDHLDVEKAKQLVLRAETDLEIDFCEEMDMISEAYEIMKGCANIALHMRQFGIVDNRNEFLTLSIKHNCNCISCQPIHMNTGSVYQFANFTYEPYEPKIEKIMEEHVIECNPSKYARIRR